MKAPISKQAEEILPDPAKAIKLIQAIRLTRESSVESAELPLDHEKLNVKIVRIDHST